jgi:hypothetical protein
MAEHSEGETPLRIGAGSILLADGAIVRANAGDPRGAALIFPPADPIERARHIVRFWNAKHHSALMAYRAFNQLKHCGGQVAWDVHDFGQPPRLANGRIDESVDAALARLDEIVKRRRAKLEVAKAELKKLAPDIFNPAGGP